MPNRLIYFRWNSQKAQDIIYHLVQPHLNYPAIPDRIPPRIPRIMQETAASMRHRWAKFCPEPLRDLPILKPDWHIDLPIRVTGCIDILTSRLIPLGEDPKPRQSATFNTNLVCTDRVRTFFHAPPLRRQTREAPEQPISVVNCHSMPLLNPRTLDS